MSERQRQALHGSRPAERLTRHPQLQRMWGASAALAGQSPCLSSLSWSRARPAVLRRTWTGTPKMKRRPGRVLRAPECHQPSQGL